MAKLKALKSFFDIVKEYLANSSLHGAKYIADAKYNLYERVFWMVCIIVSWTGSFLLISASLDAFNNNAISFVVETSYLNWKTEFPAIVLCENKNMDRVQSVSDELFGEDHDFTLEELLSEIAYFRGESYHTVHECGSEEKNEHCLLNNYSYYAKVVRSTCLGTLSQCFWNEDEFDCCKYFQPMQTEMGLCYALNSAQSNLKNAPKLDMISDKFTGPGRLKMNILTEAFIYTLGPDDVPNLVTPKSDILQIDQFISYKRQISVKTIENDPETKDVSVRQRNCRYPDENYLSVHRLYSYSACSVQCRRDEQIKVCNCTSHLMPNTPESLFCNISGLICLNNHYEDLSVVIAPWTKSRKGVICNCMPSCTEVDVLIIHDWRDNLLDDGEPFSIVEIALNALPTERYKRNVIRGRLDMVVSVGGTTGLFVGASLLSFVEIIYYFTIRAGLFQIKLTRRKEKLQPN